MARPPKPKTKCICKKCEIEFYTRPSEAREFCSGPCAQQYKGVNKDWLIKRNATNLKKYGDEVSFRSPQVQAVYKANLKEKYGVENPFLVKEFRDKADETIMDRYGTEYATQNPEIANKVSEALKGREVPRDEFTERKWNQLIDYYKTTKMLPIFYKNDFINCRVGDSSKRWLFKCEICGKEDDYTLVNNYMPVCSCVKKPLSSIEEDIKNFLLEYIPENEIFINKRTILGNGQELDIYIPSHNIAIELNGIFWHSEVCGKDRKYHLNKTEICLSKNINLIHILDQEWIFKKNIIKSMLLNKIGKTFDKIYARKCEIRKITDNNELKIFLNINHIQGYTHSSINIGLYYNEELISVMTFGKNRFKKDSNEWEMVRFCNKLNINIVGGASKLFKHFINEYNSDKLPIISFADRRFFSGGLYGNLGFKFDKFTSPSYIYWKNNIILNRMACQKHKLHQLLETFSEEKSEYDNMLENGWRRVWDCGNSKWIFK